MGYQSIQNLYQFVRDYPVEYKAEKEVYAMEKIHGTSAHIAFEKDQPIRFFAGGEKQSRFEAIFDKEKLQAIYERLKTPVKLILYGESYGSMMKMSHTYGEGVKFVGFEVKADDDWLSVPTAESFTRQFGLDFVSYWRGPNEIEWLDQMRDRPSEQAKKNGITEDRISEGVVCKPIQNKMIGCHRWIFKHKRQEFAEIRTPRVIGDEEVLMMTKAKEISYEWVTPMRLDHILSKDFRDWSLQDSGFVVKSMISDIQKESIGEIKDWSKNLEKSIGHRTIILYKEYLNKMSM